MTLVNRIWPSIKDHPLIIVLGFCATTAAATATVYERFVIPYHTKILEVQVADLTRQLELMPNTEKAISERDASIAMLREEIFELKKRSIELTKENVFSADDPYPKAFRSVRIGDLFSKLEDNYPGKISKDDPDDEYASIAVDDFFFSGVTYYYDGLSEPHRVTQILFHLKWDIELQGLSKAPSDASIRHPIEDRTQAYVRALRTQLTERYGQGKVGKRETTWKVKDLLITLENKGFLLISKP